MKRSLRTFVLLVSLLASAGIPTTGLAQAQDVPESNIPVITDSVPRSHALRAASTADYVYPLMYSNVFLRSDESAVKYLENTIRNLGSTPMTSHTWCFYWGLDAYDNVFARDDLGYLDAYYYTNYSDTFNRWGLCVETTFRRAIGMNEEYEYAVGILVEGHHNVYYDDLSASWRVVSYNAMERYVSEASWPHNQESFTASPEPTYLGQSYAYWERTNQDVPFDFTINVDVTLGDTMAVDPLSQGTKNSQGEFTGDDIYWEDEPYGVGTPWVIGEKGCYLTAGAMAMNYFAEVLGFTTSTDPYCLNDALTDIPAGYSTNGCPYGSGCNVSSGAFDTASVELFGDSEADDVEQEPLIVRGEREALTDVSDMRDNLQNGELGILNVWNGVGHWVLATGYTSISGEDTVTINDPFEDRGSTTLYEQYGNSYAGTVVWLRRGHETVRPNYVTILADCPVEMLITDEYGRRTGYDPRTEMRYDEIPSSEYVVEYHPHHSPGDEGTKVLDLQTMDHSQYQLEVIGTGSGSYSLQYMADLAYADDEIKMITGHTSQGEVDEYNIEFDPNHGFVTHGIYIPLVVRQARQIEPAPRQ